MYRENLRQYWREHCVHVGIALASLLLAITVHPVCALLFAGQFVRQICGYWSKKDTVNIDLAYVLGGGLVGVIGGVVVKVFL